MKNHGKGKMKPYSSPGHVHDHPAHNMPDPSGGLMAGASPQGMGMPMGAPQMGPGGPPQQGMM